MTSKSGRIYLRTVTQTWTTEWVALAIQIPLHRRLGPTLLTRMMLACHRVQGQSPPTLMMLLLRRLLLTTTLDHLAVALGGKLVAINLLNRGGTTVIHLCGTLVMIMKRC